MTEDRAKTEDELHEQMDNWGTPELLKEAHHAFIKDLTAKARAGTLTKEEMAVLRNVLKDNGMVNGIAPDDAPKGRPGDAPRPLPELPPREL